MNKKIRLIIYSSILVIGFISLIVQLLSNQYEQIKLVSIKNVNVEKIILENINNSFSLEGSEKDYFLNEFKKPGVIAHHSAPRRALNNLYLTVNVKIMFKDKKILNYTIDQDSDIWEEFWTYSKGADNEFKQFRSKWILNLLRREKLYDF